MAKTVSALRYDRFLLWQIQSYAPSFELHDVPLSNIIRKQGADGWKKIFALACSGAH
jgi:hypothetical protein